MLYARGTTPQVGCAMQILGQDVTDNHSINPEQMCVSDSGVLSVPQRNHSRISNWDPFIFVLQRKLF
jgi:hypothetical protein